MNRLVLALALATALPTAYAISDAPDLSKVNGSLVAKAGQTYGDIDTVEGGGAGLHAVASDRKRNGILVGNG